MKDSCHFTSFVNITLIPNKNFTLSIIAILQATYISWFFTVEKSYFLS